MTLQPRHIQILTILKAHKDGLTTADIFKISQTMVGNEIPKDDGTSMVSKLVYSLRGVGLIKTYDAGKVKLHKLSPLGHEALLKSDEDFELPAEPILSTPPEVPEKVIVTLSPTAVKEVAENDDYFILKKDSFYQPLFDMVTKVENHLLEIKKKTSLFLLEEKIELLEDIANAKFIDEERAHHLRDIADYLRN